ncbi:MAG: PAS domain S-box protein [Desulfobacterales bacterium]
MKIKSLFFLLLLLINFIPASPVYAGDIIKFGLHQNPPLNFTDADGHVKGFVIDILEYVASQEGWQIEYVPCDGPQCRKQLAAGEIDLMGAIAYSEKRTEQYDFNSETLITNWGQIYIHPGSDINSILDLEGKKIALIKKGIHSIALHKMLESFKINGIFVEVPDFPAIFNLIDRGEADAGAVNRLFAIQNEGKYNVKGLPIIFNPIEIRFAVTKNRHPDLLAALDNHLEKLKADRGSVYYQSLNKWFRIEHKPALSDRLKWVLGSTIGLIILFIGISILLKLQVRSRTRNLAVEIAEHKKAEDVLRESEERHRLLVESSSDAILVLDVDRKIVSCNRAFLALFGYDLSEVIGQSTSMIHPSEESYRSFGDAAYLEIKRSDSFRAEWEFLRRDGAVFPAETTTSAIKLPDGETTGYVAIIRDITERKKAEEAVQRAKEKTDLANRAKGEFLANMSHEIRTPMNSVIGFTDMLIDTDLNEEQKNYAETIKSSGETLLSLINDILDFSKIEAGELDFEAVDFDPGLLAYDICNAIRPRVGSKPVEIICHIGDDLPAYVNGDPGRFRQVLTNLMSNASKFTDKGEIELSLIAEP